jgi:hypothetical protein
VQYIRFALTPDRRARWRQGVRLVAGHPHYRAEAELTPEQLAELELDFQ